MSDVASILSGLSAQNKFQSTTTTGGSALGKDDFLKLMITQMKNQNPLNPTDNTAFVAQLAQFSSLESLNNLNSSFQTLASSLTSNQALQASSLVGRSVSVNADTTVYQQGALVSGMANIPQSTPDVRVMIYNADNGALVQQVDAGAQSAGNMVFRWDGGNFEVNGKLVQSVQAGQQPPAAGNYKFVVQAVQDGKPLQLQTALSANVNSVTLDPDKGLILNLAGIGPVAIGDVKQFN